MTGYPAVTHRSIHPDNQGTVDALEARYAHLGLRFDTGFEGSWPVQASGRIGRRFFYFRFKYDTATLTVGSPDRRRDAGYHRLQRVKALRATRRFNGSPIDRFWAELGLRPTLHLDRHPSIKVRSAAVHDVTGDEYAHVLDGEMTEELFGKLVDGLKPDVYQNVGGHLKGIIRGSRTSPLPPHRHVISKKSR